MAMVITVAVLLPAAAALVAVTRPVSEPRRRALAGVLLIALAAAGWQVGGGERLGAVAVDLGLLLLGLVLIALAWWHRADPAEPASLGLGSAPWPSSDSGAATLLTVHAACAVLVLLLPHLHLVGLGVILAAIAGALLDRRLEGGALQFGQGITILLLLGSWYALNTVAGSAPLTLAALAEAPYSEAFEIAVALPLTLAAWPLLGLFPFHKTRFGPLSPLAGGALLVRVAAAAVPNGLTHWQPLLYLLVTLAMMHALFTRRDAEALTALAALGMLSGATVAGWCGLGLAAAAGAMRGHAVLVASGRMLNARGRLLVQGMAVAVALLLVPVLAGGLGAEAVYTALTTFGGCFLLWKR